MNSIGTQYPLGVIWNLRVKFLQMSNQLIRS